MNKNLLLFSCLCIASGVAFGSQRTTPEMFLPDAAELSRDLTAAQSLWDIARTPVPEEQSPHMDDSGMDDSDTESSIMSLPDDPVVKTTENQTLLEAFAYYKRQDYKKAAEKFKKVANNTSDPLAQADAWYQLGELYYHGTGVSQNKDTAIRYWEKASRQNDNLSAKAWGAAQLGGMYVYGDLVTQDLDQAKSYYNKALSLQSDPALRNLVNQGLQEIERLKKEATMDQFSDN
jgi:tetratricopeptide (TPR) repeat protein